MSLSEHGLSLEKSEGQYDKEMQPKIFLVSSALCQILWASSDIVEEGAERYVLNHNGQCLSQPDLQVIP